MNAALAHLHDFAGIFSASRSDVSSVTSNVCRLRLFTPTISAPESSAGSSSACIVHFHQRGHFVLRRQLAKPPHLGFVQQRGDQQNRIGAMRGGFDHVNFVDREILAQHRQCNGAIARTPDRPACLGRNRNRSGRSARPRRPIRRPARWPPDRNCSSSTPLLGDAFLISEIIAGWEDVSARSKIPSAPARFAAVRSSSARCCAVSRSSACLFLTMRARMSGTTTAMSGRFHGSITRTRIPLAGSIEQVQEPPWSIATRRALSRLKAEPGGSDATER